MKSLTLLLTLLICTIANGQTVYYPGKDTALLKKIAKNEAYADSLDKIMIVRIDRKNLVINEPMIDTTAVLFRDPSPARDTNKILMQICDTSMRRLKYCCKDGQFYDTTMAVNGFVQWLRGYQVVDRSKPYIYQVIGYLDERKTALPERFYAWAVVRVEWK